MPWFCIRSAIIYLARLLYKMLVWYIYIYIYICIHKYICGIIKMSSLKTKIRFPFNLFSLFNFHYFSDSVEALFIDTLNPSDLYFWNFEEKRKKDLPFFGVIKKTLNLLNGLSDYSYIRGDSLDFWQSKSPSISI